MNTSDHRGSFGIIGSGSWATALAKILTDNNHTINWLVRTDAMSEAILKSKHNPNYLNTVAFDTSLLNLQTNVSKVIEASDLIIIATPSAYVVDTLKSLSNKDFEGKKIISAVKGIIPQENILLNDYLQNQFNVDLKDYFTIMGPCVYGLPGPHLHVFPLQYYEYRHCEENPPFHQHCWRSIRLENYHRNQAHAQFRHQAHKCF